MKKRSSLRRVPELVTRPAFHGLSENEIGRAADIHDDQERKRSVQGPDTEAQDLSPPDHNFRHAMRGRSIQTGHSRRYGLHKQAQGLALSNGHILRLWRQSAGRWPQVGSACPSGYSSSRTSGRLGRWRTLCPPAGRRAWAPTASRPDAKADSRCRHALRDFRPSPTAAAHSNCSRRPQGCTELLLLAHGFTIAQMSRLCAQPRWHCKQVRQRSRSKPLKRGASSPPNQGLVVDRVEAAMAAFAKIWRPE